MRTELGLACGLLAVLAVGCGGGHEPAAESTSEPASAPVGEVGAPLRARAGELNVLVFVTTDCPIANKFAPEIESIRQDYAERGVRLFLVHVDPEVDQAAAEAHAQEYGHGAELLRDPEHELVAATGVEITPEVSVHDDTGAQLYRGRIDDRFGQLGSRRPEANHRDLRDALDAVLAGGLPPVPTTKAVGCLIADFR